MAWIRKSSTARRNSPIRQRSSTGLGTSAPGPLGELTRLHALPEADYLLGEDELTTLKVIRYDLFVPAIPVSCGSGEPHFRQPERELHPAGIRFVQTVVHYYHSNASSRRMLGYAAGFEDLAGCNRTASVQSSLHRVVGHLQS